MQPPSGAERLQSELKPGPSAHSLVDSRTNDISAMSNDISTKLSSGDAYSSIVGLFVSPTREMGILTDFVNKLMLELQLHIEVYSVAEARDISEFLSLKNRCILSDDEFRLRIDAVEGEDCIIIACWRMQHDC